MRLPRLLALPVLVLLAAVTMTVTAPAGAAPGDLDVSFSADGSSEQGPWTFSSMGGISLDADGSSVFVASTVDSTSTYGRYFVQRVGTAGETLGSGTSSAPAGSPHHGTFTDLVRIPLGLANAGKYVGVVRTNLGLELVRLNADFTQDLNVVVVPAAASLTDIGVALDAQGRIVLAANALSGQGQVRRFLPDGTSDATFGAGGVATIPTTGGSFAARDIVVDGGSVFVGGHRGGSLIVVKMTSAGALDMSFSSDGFATTSTSSGTDLGNEMLVQADGKVVIVGGYAKFDVVRFTTMGDLDVTFGGDGIVQTVRDVNCCDGNGGAVATGVAQQVDGRLVVVGRFKGLSTSADTRTRLAVVRYNVDGTLDTTFAGDGILWNSPEATPEATGIYSSASDVVVQADGKILVAAAGTSPFNRRIIRFHGGRPPEADFTPTTAIVNEPVTLTSSSTVTAPATIATTLWDTDNDGVFDNGSGSTISHTFTTSGSQLVGIRVTDTDGYSHTTTKSVAVNVRPVASFTWAPMPAFAGETITFTSTASATAPNTIADGSIAWDLDNDGAFDDGTGSPITYTFTGVGAVGDHLVRQRVTDSAGNSDEVALVVAVVARPVVDTPPPIVVAPPVVAPPVVTPPAGNPQLDAILGQLTTNFVLGLKLPTGETARMPPYAARRATVDQVQSDLGLNRDLNVQYKLRPAPLASLPKAMRASAKPYQVIATKPAAGAALTSSFPGPAQLVELTYYDPKIPRDANCPYATGKVGTLDMWAVIRGMGVFEGADQLDDLGCNFEITGVDYVRSVNELTIYKFAATTVKGKRLLRVRIGAPKQPDFRAAFIQPIQKGYETELGLANDGSVVASTQTQSMGVTVLERATGRLVQHLPVKLLDPSGDVIAAGRTDVGGFVHLQFSFKQQTGQLRLVMEHVEPRTGNVLMSAVQGLQIVKRPGGWSDMNGNDMVRDTRFKDARYKRSGVVHTLGKSKRGTARAYSYKGSAVELYEPMLQALEQQIAVLISSTGVGGKVTAAHMVQAMREALQGKTVEEISRETGFSVGFLGNSQSVLATNGELAHGVRSNTVRLLGQDGAGMYSVTGAGIISGGAGNIISGGAGNIISGGAGNIISGGAGNIISGGGGNIISGGAGNIISGGAGNIISGGAGNFRSRALFRPFVASDIAFRSTRYLADARSLRVHEIDELTIVANVDGSVPDGLLFAEELGATPITVPGKLR